MIKASDMAHAKKATSGQTNWISVICRLFLSQLEARMNRCMLNEIHTPPTNKPKTNKNFLIRDSFIVFSQKTAVNAAVSIANSRLNSAESSFCWRRRWMACRNRRSRRYSCKCQSDCCQCRHGSSCCSDSQYSCCGSEKTRNCRNVTKVGRVPRIDCTCYRYSSHIANTLAIETEASPVTDIPARSTDASAVAASTVAAVVTARNPTCFVYCQTTHFLLSLNQDL